VPVPQVQPLSEQQAREEKQDREERENREAAAVMAQRPAPTRRARASDFFEGGDREDLVATLEERRRAAAQATSAMEDRKRLARDTHVTNGLAPESFEASWAGMDDDREERLRKRRPGTPSLRRDVQRRAGEILERRNSRDIAKLLENEIIVETRPTWVRKAEWSRELTARMEEQNAKADHGMQAGAAALRTSKVASGWSRAASATATAKGTGQAAQQGQSGYTREPRLENLRGISNDPAWMTSGRTVHTESSGAEASDEVIADEPPKPPGVRRVDWARTLAAAKQEQQAKVAAGTTMAHERGQEAQQDQLRQARTPKNVQVGPSVVQPIDELHVAKMPRLGERALPEERPSIDDGAMASKAGVSSAAKSNKAILKPPQRTLQAATIPATIAPAELTAATMATGSEGADGGAGESAAPTGVQQLPPEVWSSMSRTAKKNYLQYHNNGARKQGGK